MRQDGTHIGQGTESKKTYAVLNSTHTGDFVLEKSIFNNIFEKDIRRVYIYKKAERLAKAATLISPAFVASPALHARIQGVALGLIDAALLPPQLSRKQLSTELLALSSVLSVARIGGMLSSMNADLIAREAQVLLQEVASYEEPRLSFDEVVSLSTIAKQTGKSEEVGRTPMSPKPRTTPTPPPKGHVKDISDSEGVKDRREAILSVIKNKQPASIKDISTLIRNVSEKTIQRELMSLILAGQIIKEGERRWSTYRLAAHTS